MIESDLSTSLADTTEKSAVVMQRQAPKMHMCRKLCRVAHSIIVDVHLCLIFKIAGTVKVLEVQFIDQIVKVQNMMVRTSSK